MQDNRVGVRRNDGEVKLSRASVELALCSLKHDEIRFDRRRGDGELPLPPNSGSPELGIINCRSRINPTSIRRGLG